MKKQEIKVDTIYRLTNGTEGLKICIMESNRNVPSQIKKMLKSIREIGQQQPGLFTEATYLFNAGYKLIDVDDNHVVAENEVEGYLCIFDGNTKFHAYEMATKEGNPFEYKFQYVTFPDMDTCVKTYRGINMANTPTRTKDYVRDFQATSTHPILSLFRARVEDGLYPKSAGFSIFGEELQKKHVEMLWKGETPALFQDEENIARYNRIYDSMRELVKENPKEFRGTEVWCFISSKMNKAADKNEMAAKIINFFENLPHKVFTAMQKAKKDGAKSRAQVVSEILENAMN